MRPILKNIATLQHLIEHTRFKIRHTRVQNVMMRTLNHRNGIDLHIADVHDRLTRPRQTTTVGLVLEQTLRRQSQTAQMCHVLWIFNLDHARVHLLQLLDENSLMRRFPIIAHADFGQ